MPELRWYLKQDVPRDIAAQIRSYIRMQWPQLNPGLTKIWTAPPGFPLDRMVFVLMEDELLISHAETSFREVDHAGQRYKVGGLSAVFTYPAHRGTGAGEQVVHAATEHLRGGGGGGGADLSLLFCGERVKSLYLRTGWEVMESQQIFFGDPATPQKTDYIVMANVATPRGQTARDLWNREAAYVGPTLW
jgi:aminoglycoside 2'-N-acetyltransferase I